MNGLLRTPALTPRRIWLALAIAIAADGVQMLLGPAGWLFADELIDVAAMGSISLVLGFHPLFIPTFIAEIIPVVDMLQTWTGCVGVVIALRRRQQRAAASPPPPVSPRDDVIDV